MIYGYDVQDDGRLFREQIKQKSEMLLKKWCKFSRPVSMVWNQFAEMHCTVKAWRLLDKQSLIAGGFKEVLSMQNSMLRRLVVH